MASLDFLCRLVKLVFSSGQRGFRLSMVWPAKNCLARICRTSLVLGLLSVTLGAEEIAKIDPELSAIKRSDGLPVENFQHATDPYLEGYIQALIDMHYFEYGVIVVVKDHKVYLYNLPKNELVAKSIISFIQDLPGVKSVEVRKELPKEEMALRKQYTETPRVDGVWFPQSTVLFAPLVADPREPVYSVNYREGDKVMGQEAVAVSLGDDFPIFRWRNVFRWHGDLQIGISAGVWAVFNFHDVPHRKKNTCELMNTDYKVGIPLTYAFDKWSARLLLYHISGGLRVYGGPGIVFQSDPSFKLKPLYVKWGTEVRLFGRKLYYHRLYGTPFFAAHMENWQQHHWDLDSTFKLGYEISKLQGVGRKMRLYIDYHQGFSYEGQFFNQKTRYGEIGLSWGF
jgi:hypothetical protein